MNAMNGHRFPRGDRKASVYPGKRSKGAEVITLDIGGTHMRVALVRDGKIVDGMKFPTPKNKKVFLRNMEAYIDMYLSKKVKGIGVSIAGPVNDGVVLFTPNIALGKYDLKKHLKKRFKKPVEVSNDVNCYAISELKKGEKKSNFLFVAVGTDIGGGIVIDGKIYSGEGYSGEFSYLSIGDKTWGEEWFAVKDKVHKSHKGKFVTDVVKMKDPKSKKMAKEAAEVLGKGFASLVHSFDPEVIYVAGSLRNAGNSFLKIVEKDMNSRLKFGNKKKLKFGSIEHGALVGAYYLIE